MDYYAHASSALTIHNIKVPTLIMNARDDPLLGPDSIAYKECRANPNVLLAVTEKGGHLGYFENAISSKQWFTKPVFEFFESHAKKNAPA